MKAIGSAAALFLCLAVAAPAGAVVLCVKKSGVVVQRSACREKEKPLDLTQFGAVGPKGDKGDPGGNGIPCLSAMGNDVFFTGCNVHIRNGSGSTSGADNGLGNLVVGYNLNTQGHATRTGSHNLVVGDEHEYQSSGGFVAGFGNTITAIGASVSGGTGNTASAFYASVSGGLFNAASGPTAAVSGGQCNVAGPGALPSCTPIAGNMSVSGGFSNQASGDRASVSGGSRNTANGEGASVSGGRCNVAGSGLATSCASEVAGTREMSVSGGISNHASGDGASVSGGFHTAAIARAASVSGGDYNFATGPYASVSGGSFNVASGENASVSGGDGNEASGPFASVSGGDNVTESANDGWSAGSNGPALGPNSFFSH